MSFGIIAWSLIGNLANGAERERDALDDLVDAEPADSVTASQKKAKIHR